MLAEYTLSPHGHVAVAHPENGIVCLLLEEIVSGDSR